MNALTSEHIRGVDIHLGVILQVLVAVCRVEVKSPDENKEA